MKNNYFERIVDKASTNYFYKEKYKNLKANNLTFEELPFIDSNEVQIAYNNSEKQNGTVFFTSGTTSNPKAFFHSNGDIEYISDYIKWFCEIEKIQGNKIILVLMDQSFWGIGYMTGLGHIKANNTVIPVDNDLPIEKIKEIIDISKPNVISSLPSVLLEMKDIAKNHRFELIETTGEKLSQKDRDKIENLFGGEVYDAYGMTEAVIGTECNIHNGYHFNPEKINLFIVDSRTKKILPENHWGELVVTTLNLKENGTPIIKYLSGDRCKISFQNCSCGLPYPKVWIDGRIEPTIFLHEGYELKISDVQEIINSNSKQRTFVKCTAVKNGNAYSLKIFCNTLIESNLEYEIIDSFCNYSHELMYMIRKGQINFEFIKINEN